MGLYKGSNSVHRLWLGSDAVAAYYGTVLVWQAADPGADWFWQENGAGVTLLLYRGNDSFLTIPAMINGLPVTALAATACNYADIRAVTIPGSVTVLD